jgi:hypothetical protein
VTELVGVDGRLFASVERAQVGHLGVGQREAEHVEIAPKALRVARHGDRHEPLLHVLAQHDLRGYPAVRRMPDRIMGQTVACLEPCATATEPIGPTELVAIGWHTFIHYTHEYAEFCDRIAGRFIHHVPDVDPTGDEWPTAPKASAATLAVTVAAMRKARCVVDPELWSRTAASDCTQCHAGCHDSPTR